MTRRLWDDYLTDRDREVFRQSGFGATAGFGERPALMIIDVSYGFAGDRPEPILQSIKRWSNSCGAESWDAIAVIADLADAFRAKELPVLYTTGEIRPDGWDIGSWAWKNGRTGEQTRPPAGMDPNQIVPALAPQPRDIVVTKQKPSAFFGTPMSSYLNLLGCDSIVVTGTTTSGCVRASVIDAFSENYRLTVVEDGCFDRSQASHAINLCDMHAKYADVVPATEVLSYVDGLPEGLFAGRLPAGTPAGAAAAAAQ